MSQAGIASFQNSNPHVATHYVTDAGVAIPAASILNVLGGTGITTTGVGNTITIIAVGSGFTWQIVTSAMNPVTLAPENGYITKGVGVVQFVLPAASVVGDTFRIIGYGNLWTIAQNAGQSIRLGMVNSTAGVGGSVSASMVTDCLDIICVTANLEFFCNTIQGNPLIV